MIILNRSKTATDTPRLPDKKRGLALVFALAREKTGAVLVEVAVVLILMFVFILGSIDFLYAFYQWNAAGKAVQIGARIAAVSDPVANGLSELSTAVVNPFVPPGADMPGFLVRCDRQRRRLALAPGLVPGSAPITA